MWNEHLFVLQMGLFCGTEGVWFYLVICIIAVFLFSCYFSLLCSWLLQAFSGKQMAGAMTYNFIKAIKENPKITYGGLLISMHTAIKEAKETGCLNLKRLFRRKILQVVSFSFLFTFQHGMRNYTQRNSVLSVVQSRTN